MTNNESAVVLTIAETAQLLRLTENTVRAAIKDGQLPSVRIRRRVLVPRARLMALLAANEGTGDDRQ